MKDVNEIQKLDKYEADAHDMLGRNRPLDLLQKSNTSVQYWCNTGLPY